MSQTSTIRILFTKLRHPNNIAIGVSLGFHLLLLGVALPKLKTTEVRIGDRFVGVVELDSDAVSRLPFYPSSVNVASSPNPSFFPENPQLVEQNPDNNNQQPLQSLFPNLPAIPLPTPVSIPQPQSIATFLSPPPPPPVILNEPESVITPTPDTEQSNPSSNPSDSFQVPILAKKPKPSPPPIDILAKPEKNHQVAVRQLVDLLKYEPKNTSNKEAIINYFKWLVAIDAEETIDLTLTGTYPEAACMKKLEGTSIYGVKLSADGTVTDAELVKSSGYLLLNQQALENINSGTWINSIEPTKSYRISVNFNYEPAVCPSLTVPQLSPSRSFN